MTASAPATILFAHSGRDWIRGSERCLLDLIARLDRTQFTPVLACESRILADEARALGAAIEHVPEWRDGWRPPMEQVRRVQRIMQAHRVRLVHANNLIPIPSVLPVARSGGIPVVAHIHLMMTREERLHSWLHQAAAIVGVSRHVVAGLLDDGMPPSRVHVVYNGIDRSRLAAGDARGLRASLGIASDAFVATVVGSLIEIKGQRVIIDAIGALRASGVDAHLLVVGDGEARPALEAQAAALGLAAHVHVLGERGDVGAMLRDATDVAVTASRMEAFPLNVLEAQYAGVPVVASDIPAHREGVAVGETGLLFPPGDAPALAAHLAALAGAPERRRAMGAAGHARVMARFLVERYADELQALYRTLLAEPAARHGWRGSVWPAAYGEWIRGAVGRRLARVRRRTSA